MSWLEGVRARNMGLACVGSRQFNIAVIEVLKLDTVFHHSDPSIYMYIYAII